MKNSRLKTTRVKIGDSVSVLRFKITCPCQTLLEVYEGNVIECPNCGRELDDRGNEI